MNPVEIDLRPPEVYLKLYRGESVGGYVELYNNDGVTPINLTGATARLTLRTNPTADPPIATLAISDGLTIPTPTTGRINIVPTNTQWGLMAGKTLTFDLEVTYSGGVIVTELRGKLETTWDVSR